MASAVQSAEASGELVQLPLTQKGTCTRNSLPDLLFKTVAKTRGELLARGLQPSRHQISALQDAASIMVDMAERRCPPQIYLSSLDTGMGKTTLLVQFLKEVSKSLDHSMVGVVVCLSRLNELDRLVNEAELRHEKFAVLTGDDDRNSCSATPPNEAQILFTTQQMVMRRGEGRSFHDCTEFHFMGMPREVRIWDETLEPGGIVTLSTDDLSGLLGPLRKVSSSAADFLQDLWIELSQAKPGSILQLPDFAATPLMAVCLSSELDQSGRLTRLMSLSDRRVKVIAGMGKERIALDIRDAIPRDLAPILVLDASGRVRRTYQHWEHQKGGLVRLTSAVKDYRNLKVHVLDQGGGKDSWRRNGEQLAREVAALIDSKSEERWLVVHHKADGTIDPSGLIMRYVNTNPDRISFLHYGRHQATNDFKDIPNVILAGTLFLPMVQVTGLAHSSMGLPLEAELPNVVLREVRLGEIGHVVVQAVGRGSSRGCQDGKCQPCDVYLIADKKSGIGEALKEWFPGCHLRAWVPMHRRLRGRVSKADAFLKDRLAVDPTAPVMFAEVMEHLGETDLSNFNRTIRKHEDFRSAIDDLGLHEVKIGKGRGKNAFQRLCSPVEGNHFPIADL
jgi:hypothetical protein